MALACPKKRKTKYLSRLFSFRSSILIVICVSFVHSFNGFRIFIILFGATLTAPDYALFSYEIFKLIEMLQVWTKINKI